MNLVAILQKYQGTMSQREYARVLGLSSGILSLIYSGQRGIGLEVLQALARAFPDAADEITTALTAPSDSAIAVAS